MIGTFLLVGQLASAADEPVVGDPARGRQLATDCFACHGQDGNSPSPVVPRIGGQHERYLLLALQAYIDDKRADSLMRGAVLNKSEQELADIAAYFAAQATALQSGAAKAAAPGTPDRGGPGGGRGPGGPPGGGPGGVMKFDHGERMAEFTAMLARARSIAAYAERATDPSLCDVSVTGMSDSLDSDNDGLADVFDGAPDDASEFVADRSGDGVFEICNIHQLQAIATLGTPPASSELTPDARRARSYQLVRDLNAAAIENFVPIGDCGPTGNCMRALGQFGFSGTFDGQGRTIRGLRMRWPDRGGVGLFGVLAETGVVMNLRLLDTDIEGRAGTGALVGSNFGTIYRSSVDGRVAGRMAIGGLVGGSGGLVYGSESRGAVTGEQALGGLVGDMTGAVYFSAAHGTVDGTRGVGGLVGLNTFGTVLDSYATGGVSGANDIGGLVGVNTDAKVKGSYATGDVRGSASNIGGLIGFNSLSTVRNSYAMGAVTGADAVGGLVGRNNGIVASGYAVGPVSSAGAADAVVAVDVDSGRQENLFSLADGITAMNGDDTAWAPSVLPAVKTVDFFCDLNRNGFIDPSERTTANYVWDFGSEAQDPGLRCVADGLGRQRNQ